MRVVSKILIFLLLIISHSHANKPCIEDSRICVEGGASRVINGVLVYKECWKYEISYKCETDNYIDHCSEIQKTPDCTISKSECAIKDGDICLQYKNAYHCKNYISGIKLSDKVTYSYGKETKDSIDESACENYSTNKYCAFDKQQCLDSKDRLINNLKLSRDCWQYQKEYICKNDDYTRSDCRDLENDCNYSHQSCLSNSDDGKCTNYERFYNCSKKSSNKSEALQCGSQTYNYERNTDLLQVASKLNALFAAGKDNDGVSIFKGEANGCDKAVMGSNNCCKNSGWGNDAGISSCSGSEKALAERKGLGYCHYVGSYCSEKEKLTGICLKTRLNYCCFGGKIARIVQQQGRVQMGKSWGGSNSPDCSGLKLTDLEGLDFSVMDFSEMAEDINIKSFDGSKFNTEIKARIKSMMRKKDDT